MPDHLTREQRFRAMSRVKLKDGSLEKIIQSELRRRGYTFRRHVKGLPGTPDLVLPKKKVAVFIDGDFWHGYDFQKWKGGLSKFWVDKISRNIMRWTQVTT